MNEAVAGYDQTGDISGVSSLTSLAALRAELTVLFASYQVSTELVDSFANWKTFVGVLLEDLCNRPIRLPKTPRGKTKVATEQAIARMKRKWKTNGQKHWPRAFFITLDSNRTFFWNLEYEAPALVGGDSVIIKSEVLMIETEKDFCLP